MKKDHVCACVNLVKPSDEPPHPLNPRNLNVVNLKAGQLHHVRVTTTTFITARGQQNPL